MKRLVVLLILVFVLTGCGAAEVFEQVEDVYAGTAPTPGTLHLVFPENATVLTAAGENGNALYFCDGYTLTTQVLRGGDLDRSLRELTGYGIDRLTVLETCRNGVRCVSSAWSCIGENGSQVGRLVLLDDGAYHYAVTVMASAEQAGALADRWDALLASISLSDTGPLRTGTAPGIPE